MPILNQYSKIATAATFATLPVSGEPLTLYITLDENRLYTWSGTAYQETASSQVVYRALDLAGLNALPAASKKLNALYVTTLPTELYYYDTAGTAFVKVAQNYQVVNDLTALAALTVRNEITIYLTKDTGNFYRFDIADNAFYRIGVDYQQASSLAALNLLSANERIPGRLYLAIDTGLLYRYDAGLAAFVPVASGAPIEAVNLTALNALAADQKKPNQLYVTTSNNRLYRYDVGSSSFVQVANDYQEAASLAQLNALPASQKIVGKLYLATDFATLYQYNGTAFVTVAEDFVTVETQSDLALLPTAEKRSGVLYFVKDSKQLFFFEGGFQLLNNTYVPVANFASLDLLPMEEKRPTKLYYVEDENRLYVYTPGGVFQPISVQVDIPAWMPNVAYLRGALVKRGDIVYRITEDHTSAVTFDNEFNLLVPIASHNQIFAWDNSAVNFQILSGGANFQLLNNINTANFTVIAPYANSGQDIYVVVNSNVNSQLTFLDKNSQPITNTLGPNGINIPNNIEIYSGVEAYFKLKCVMTDEIGNSFSWILSSVDFRPFKGATLSQNGQGGLVPTPGAGQQNNFLRGDGEWSLIIPNTAVGVSRKYSGGSASMPPVSYLDTPRIKIPQLFFSTYQGSELTNPFMEAPNFDRFFLNVGETVEVHVHGSAAATNLVGADNFARAFARIDKSNSLGSPLGTGCLYLLGSADPVLPSETTFSFSFVSAVADSDFYSIVLGFDPLPGFNYIGNLELREVYITITVYPAPTI